MTLAGPLPRASRALARPRSSSDRQLTLALPVPPLAQGDAKDLIRDPNADHGADLVPIGPDLPIFDRRTRPRLSSSPSQPLVDKRSLLGQMLSPSTASSPDLRQSHPCQWLRCPRMTPTESARDGGGGRRCGEAARAAAQQAPKAEAEPREAEARRRGRRERQRRRRPRIRQKAILKRLREILQNPCRSHSTKHRQKNVRAISLCRAPHRSQRRSAVKRAMRTRTNNHSDSAGLAFKPCLRSFSFQSSPCPLPTTHASMPGSAFAIKCIRVDRTF